MDRARAREVVRKAVGLSRSDDVVARLAKEQGSALDRRLDKPLEDHSDPGFVAKLGAIAKGAGRPLSHRVEATRLLGRSSKDYALDTLLELWGAPEAELRHEAAGGFEQIFPWGFRDRDEAVALVRRMRADQAAPARPAARAALQLPA